MVAQLTRLFLLHSLSLVFLSEGQVSQAADEVAELQADVLHLRQAMVDLDASLRSATNADRSQLRTKMTDLEGAFDDLQSSFAALENRSDTRVASLEMEISNLRVFFNLLSHLMNQPKPGPAPASPPQELIVCAFKQKREFWEQNIYDGSKVDRKQDYQNILGRGATIADALFQGCTLCAPYYEPSSTSLLPQLWERVTCTFVNCRWERRGTIVLPREEALELMPEQCQPPAPPPVTKPQRYRSR